MVRRQPRTVRYPSMKLAANNIFSIELSTNELYWLVSAFGYTRLALPLNNLDDDLVNSLIDGNNRLQSRNLIRPKDGVGWEVETLLVTLIRWLGDTNEFVSFDFQSRQNDSRSTYLLTSGSLGLYVEVVTEIFIFYFHPDRISITNQVVNSLGFSSVNKKSNSSSFIIRQPTDLIRLAWENIDTAIKVHDKSGNTTRDVQNTFQWLDSIQWTAVLSQKSTGIQDKPEKTVYIFGDGRAVWLSNVIIGEQDEIQMQSLLSQQSIETQICKLL